LAAGLDDLTVRLIGRHPFGAHRLVTAAARGVWYGVV